MIAVSGLTYTFPSGATLGPIDVEVAAGEFVVVCGPTGSGKSTLLRCIAGLAGRHGRGVLGGSVRVAGADPAELSPAERVVLLGFVGQDPLDQLVTGTIGDEIAFGPESARRPAEEIRTLVESLRRRYELPEATHPALALSGGQRQRLVVAGALAAGAQVLLLDEPLAQLDPAAAERLVADLAALAASGVAVVVVEHRLEPLWEVAQRLVVIDEGRVVADGPRDHVPLVLLRGLGLSLPGLVDLADRLSTSIENWRPQPFTRVRPPRGSTVLLQRNIVRHVAGKAVLRGFDVEVGAAERLAVLGANGVGKSTLLQALAEGGAPGERIDVPQDPDLALFSLTVREELAVGPQEHGRDVERIVARCATALSVTTLLERPPLALSRGQRLRVAVAAVLACEPRVLLLDEPTAGQDTEQVERMMAALADLQATVVFATHDVGLALRHATRILLLEGGNIAFDGPPEAATTAIQNSPSLRLPPLYARLDALGLPPMDAATAADRP